MPSGNLLSKHYTKCKDKILSSISLITISAFFSVFIRNKNFIKSYGRTTVALFKVNHSSSIREKL